MLAKSQIKIALLTSFLWISSAPTQALIKTTPERSVANDFTSLLDGTAVVSVSYTTVFRVHEFKGQTGQTVYDNINLGYSFA